MADVESLEKAERRVVVKNLEEPQRNLNCNSFCAFSNTRIKENLRGVGVSLGDKEDDLIRSTVLFFKRGCYMIFFDKWVLHDLAFSVNKRGVVCCAHMPFQIHTCF